jgi:hypothetical protein
MTPHEASTLDRLWDDVPVGAPPLADLVRGGRTMRRRARLRVAGGAAALTLVVVAGSTLAANTVFDAADPRPDDQVPAAVDPPTAPAGQRLVGAGRAVVAVPADWNAYGLKGCELVAKDTIWFELESTGVDLDCPSVAYRSPTVKISPLDTEGGKAAKKFATRPRVVDGVEVLRELARCPDEGFCIGDTTMRLVVVPSENVAFTISGPMDAHKMLDAIADSVQILPEGYTTVPFVEGDNVAAWKTAIAEAGLVPDGALPECEDVVSPQAGVVTNALCEAHPRIRLEPGPGSVAALGSTVTLFPTVTPSVDLRGQWRLTSALLHGQAFDAPEGAHLTLVVSEAGDQADGEGQAHAGCTVVRLDPQINGSSVTLRELDRGSRRSCPSNYQDSHLDEPYLRAVTTIDRAMRSGEELTLTGPDVRLTFVKTG